MTGKKQLPLYAFRGDTFFTRSDSVLGKVIRWAETDPGEEKTWANHTGVVVKDGWLVPPSEAYKTPVLAVVVEALAHVMHQVWWTAHKDEVLKGQRIVAYGPVEPRTMEEFAAFKFYAMSKVGARYGWWKLLFHGADRLFFKGKKRLSKLLRVDSRPICSYLAAEANFEQAMTFGMSPQAATPDEMLDYCETNQEVWGKR